MKQDSPKTSRAIVSSLLVIIGFLISYQIGCDQKRGGYETVGFPKSFADLAGKVKPAVVNISTVSMSKSLAILSGSFSGPIKKGLLEIFSTGSSAKSRIRT